MKFASYGAVGIVAVIFVKQYLQDSSKRNEQLEQERKEDREMYRISVRDFTDISKSYIESIGMLTNRVEGVEEGVEQLNIKFDTKLDKILEKVEV